MKYSVLAVAAALAASTAPLAAPTAHAAPADRFLQDAVAGDNGEVAAGRMAQQRSRNPAVVELGRTLERDHGEARRQALATARQMRVRVDADAVKPEARQLQRRLMRLSGPAFDREFARAMVSDHEKDIAKFRLQARVGDPATRQLARATLPHLQHHLAMARDAERRR